MKKCATYKSMIRNLVDKEEIIAYDDWRMVLVEGRKELYEAFYNDTMGCKVPFKPKPRTVKQASTEEGSIEQDVRFLSDDASHQRDRQVGHFTR